MRVLLDECLPEALADYLSDHDVETVRSMGWLHLHNGVLLREAAKEFDAFVTLDKGVPHQQPLAKLGLRVVVLRTYSARLSDCLKGLNDVERLLDELKPGEFGTADGRK